MTDFSSEQAAWLCFCVGERDFAIPFSTVAEVSVAETPRLIPFVPLSVGGIVNLRGEPLPVLRGEALFGSHGISLAEYVLVLAHAERRLGVIVSDVRRIDGVRYSATPKDPPGGPSFVEWVHSDGRALGLADTEGLFAAVDELLAQHAIPVVSGEASCPSGF